MAVGDAYVFPGFLTPVLTQLFFPKPLTTFLTRFCRGERRIYAGKKSRLNRGSNSQPPGHKSYTLTTEPPGRGHIHVGQYHFINLLSNKRWFLLVWSTCLLKTQWEKEKLLVTSNFSFFPHSVFYLPKEFSAIFIKFEIVVCKLFQFERV